LRRWSALAGRTPDLFVERLEDGVSDLPWARDHVVDVTGEDRQGDSCRER
jgi:hypothetical protein